MSNAFNYLSGFFVRRLATAVLLLSLLLILGSCNLTGIFGTRLAPPEWILGTWTGENGNGSIEFTEDTVIFEGQDFSENRAADKVVSDTTYQVERPELNKDGEQIDSVYTFEQQDDSDTLLFTYKSPGQESSQLYYRSED